MGRPSNYSADEGQQQEPQHRNRPAAAYPPWQAPTAAYPPLSFEARVRATYPPQIPQVNYRAPSNPEVRTSTAMASAATTTEASLASQPDVSYSRGVNQAPSNPEATTSMTEASLAASLPEETDDEEQEQGYWNGPPAAYPPRQRRAAAYQPQMPEQASLHPEAARARATTMEAAATVTAASLASQPEDGNNNEPLARARAPSLARAPSVNLRKSTSKSSSTPTVSCLHHRSTRDAPPSHLQLKVERFSSLASSKITRYNSCEFRAGGHKWKLALYPNGTKPAGAGHVSLFLVLVDKDTKNKEILATFSLFVFDNVRRNYLSVHHELTRFHTAGLESGIDKFLPLEVFKNPQNGYLLNDTCVFGAEVFLIRNEAKAQCMSLLPQNCSPFKYKWKVRDFSELGDKVQYSNIFTACGYSWKIELYPRGYNMQKGNCLSLFLALVDAARFSPDRQVLAEFKLRIVDGADGNHAEYTMTASYTASENRWGKSGFLNLSQMNDRTGYLVDDQCLIEAELTVIGCADNWS